MSVPPEMEVLEERAKALYAGVQDEKLPERFRHPEEFSAGTSGDMGRTAAAVPAASAPGPSTRAAMMYRTTNSEYGGMQPSIIEMPSQWNGKSDGVIKMQNFTVYRSDGLNTATDKPRFVDPYVTIRRK